jgi:hypothetical protein
MSKKHKNKQYGPGQGYSYGYSYPPYGYPNQYGAWPQAGFDPATGMPLGDQHYRGFGQEHSHAYGGPGYGAGGFDQGGINRDFFRDMSSFLPPQHTDQFLLGLLIGAGAAWVLGDEEIRGKLMKAVMKVYAGVAGSFEELKEQMADVRAEVASERHGDE